MTGVTKDFKEKFIDLYDDYVHSDEPRRDFLKKLVKTAGGAAAAAAVLPWLEGTGMVQVKDNRLVTGVEKFPGATGEMTAYLARPKGAKGKLPTVVVIHENRGLTPHIRDVARRFALEGFLAVAPDMISPVGGTPKDRDKARDMLYDINKNETIMNLVATAKFSGAHKNSSGLVGSVGYCWGGSMSNNLAFHHLGLKAAVAYYGRQPKKGFAAVKAAFLLHYAENDRGVNRGAKKYVKALKDAGKDVAAHTYAGTRHAFNNDGRPARYKKEAAALAWKRTIAHFKKHLG